MFGYIRDQYNNSFIVHEDDMDSESRSSKHTLRTQKDISKKNTMNIVQNVDLSDKQSIIMDQEPESLNKTQVWNDNLQKTEETNNTKQI